MYAAAPGVGHPDIVRGLTGIGDRHAGDVPPHLEDDLRQLALRARLVNRAIGMCTLGALLVCLVIIALFAAAFADVHLGRYIALAFSGAILALIGALLTFLRETYLATRSLRRNQL